MNRPAKAIALGASIAFAGVLAMAMAPRIDLEQAFGLPWLYHLRGPVHVPAEVVIVAIDEASMEKLGVPDKPRDWPRGLHAELVNYLSQSGARVIAFDLTFDTPSNQPGQDGPFSEAIRAAGNVVVTHSLRKETLALDDAAGQPMANLMIEKATLPIPPVSEAVAGHAPFLVPKAARVDAYWAFRSGSADTPTFPVLALRVHASDAPASRAGMDMPAPERERLQKTLGLLPSEGDTRYFNLYGPPRSIRTVPYFRALEAARGRADPRDPQAASAGDFRGKAVFVGYAAATPAGQDRLRDDYATVFSRPDGLNISGVELAATAFANLFEERSLRPLGQGGQLVIVLAWAAALALVFRLLRPATAVAASGVLAVLYLWLVYDRFADAAWWWPSVIPIGVELPLAMFAGTWLHYRETAREREAIRQAFGYFLPSAMVDQLTRNIATLTEANRVVFGSCLATDAGNYTTLAERMEPGPLAQLMNQYFAHLFAPVERSGGAVVDVVGDAMVAIWAAPRPQAGLRRTACEAALDIVAALERFELGHAGAPVLPTRLGLHSGDMLIGNIGAAHHYEYRAVGDIVNTASRLQGLNKVLGTQLLASGDTVAELDGIVTRPLGTFLLSGKVTELPVVEVIGRQTDVGPKATQLCGQFAVALESHRSMRWREAVEQFARILAEFPNDGPSRFYLAHCRQLLANPPPDESWSPTIAVHLK